MKRALICGVTGQDGAYLARLLTDKGYELWGTSRDAQICNRNNLLAVGVDLGPQLLSMAPSDFRSVLTTIDRSAPDEIYYLAGQSSVGLSFEQPVQTLESTTIGVLHMLEAIRLRSASVRLYHASSSECFGDLGGVAAFEGSPFRPRSPYGIAKASAHWFVSNYREAYGIFASNGILFNHESPLRPARFVTRKIVAGVRAIKQGRADTLTLGDLNIARDWGWAPEFVEAMWLILQQDRPSDYVIGTGETHTLENFVNIAFQAVGLDWRNYVRCNVDASRPTDLAWSGADPSKAAAELGWKAQYKMPDVVAKMIDAELNDHSGL